MTQGVFDAVIIGGAVMGCSAAFWLAQKAGQGADLSIAVIESDPSFAQASTALSVSSIRQQFSSEVNVRISQFGIDFIRNFRSYSGVNTDLTDLHFQENGYLFLAGTGRDPLEMRSAQDMQHRLGAHTKLLGPDQLSAKFPFLNIDDIALGSFGQQDEGWFDNMGLLQVFRQSARAMGVTFITGRVSGIQACGSRLEQVILQDGRRYGAGTVINAAGTRAAQVMGMLGQDMPVEPRKRTVFMIDAPNIRAEGAPLIIDYAGIYLRPEGKHWLTAIVPDNDAACAPDDFTPEHHLFEDLIWEKLYHRAPGFDAVKVMTCWAGHYAFNRLDQNAIIGKWPGFDNLYVMNGFSGHGLQQAPAVGRGMAELILSGAYQTVDLSSLGPDRIMNDAPQVELAIV